MSLGGVGGGLGVLSGLLRLTPRFTGLDEGLRSRPQIYKKSGDIAGCTTEEQREDVRDPLM